MLQAFYINEVKRLLPKIHGLKTALLIGSVARQEVNLFSDIDYSFLVSEIDFNIDDTVYLLKTNIKNCRFAIKSIEKRSISLLMDDTLKVDIKFYHNVEDLIKNYLGSEINLNQIRDTIQFDITGNIYDFLVEITVRKAQEGFNKEAISKNLIEKFISAFESMSNYHRLSDAVKSNFYYDQAKYYVFQLFYLSKGNFKHYYLPTGLHHMLISDYGEKETYNLVGSLFMPKFNEIKINLLKVFYDSVTALDVLKYSELEEIKVLTNWIIERDYFWNLRDISVSNSSIISRKFFVRHQFHFYQIKIKQKNYLTP